jgi:predicted nucleic acid-binding protein
VLYLDSCALVKRYVSEKGSEALESRLGAGEKLFTSALTYFEVLATLSRKLREKELQNSDFEAARDRFLSDWLFSFAIVDLDSRSTASLPDLVVRHALKGADWVHLCAALWCREMFRLVPGFAAGESRLEFAVVDEQLIRVATQCGLAVFNPEAAA